MIHKTKYYQESYPLSPFGELTVEEKNSFSMRKIALEKLKENL